MISLLKNQQCISSLNISYYLNHWRKSYITSLKDIIVGKSLVSAGMDIDRNIDRYSKFTDNIGSGNLTNTFYQNRNKFKKTGKGWRGVGFYTAHTPHSTHPWWEEQNSQNTFSLNDFRNVYPL